MPTDLNRPAAPGRSRSARGRSARQDAAVLAAAVLVMTAMLGLLVLPALGPGDGSPAALSEVARDAGGAG